MPRIPGYQADLQRQTNAPAQVADPRLARAQADQIGQLGDQIGKLGGAIQQQQNYEAARTNEARNVEVSNFGLELQNLSDAASDKSYRTASPDGSDLVTKYDAEIDKYATDRITKLKDPLTQQKAYGEYLRVKATQKDKLYADSRKMFNDYAVKSYETRMNVGVSRVTSNPTSYDKEFGDYQNTILQSGLPPLAQQNALKLGQESMATSAIQGLTQAGEYGEAKAQLLDKFSGVFDQPTIQKHIEKIDKAAADERDESLKAADHDEKAFADSLNERKNKNFLNIHKEISSLNTLDPFDPKKGKSIQDMNKKIDDQVSAGELRFSESMHLKRILNKEDSDDSSTVALSFYSRMAKGGSVDSLREDVLKASASGLISTKSATSLLNNLQYEKEKRSRRGSKGYSKVKDEMLKESVHLIEAHFKPSSLTFDRGYLEAQEAATKQKFYSLYYGNPKYKGKPLEASKEALRQNVPTFKYPEHAPVSEKKALDNPQAAAKSLDALYQKGSITKAAYYEGLSNIKKLSLKKKVDGNGK